MKAFLCPLPGAEYYLEKNERGLDPVIFVVGVERAVVVGASLPIPSAAVSP
jgi:hypothetical protein